MTTVIHLSIPFSDAHSHLLTACRGRLFYQLVSRNIAVASFELERLRIYVYIQEARNERRRIMSCKVARSQSRSVMTTSWMVFVLLMALVAAAVASEPPKPQGGCSDAGPPGKYTCQQQKGYGKCNASFMQTYCNKTCGRCTSAVPTPAPSKNPGPYTPADFHQCGGTGGECAGSKAAKCKDAQWPANQGGACKTGLICHRGSNQYYWGCMVKPSGSG
jgi:hypothetical protein